MENMQSLGLICAAASSVFWTLTYVLIIRRGHLDQRLGMPMIALAANLTWECYFLVFSLHHGHFDVRLALLLPWCAFDFAIAYQCICYGRDDHSNPIVKKFYHIGILGILALVSAVLIGFIQTFEDTIGWYTAYGQNLLMSALFISMILRRDTLEGQSIYIALCKLMGTLFAFLLALGWSPDSLHAVWQQLIPDHYTPIAPFLITLYCGVLILDLIYIALIIHVGRRDGVKIWRHF